MNLWNLFDASVRKHSSKTAIVFGDRRITYSQMFFLSSHMAEKLSAMLQGKSRKVFILSRNSIEMVALVLACLKIRATACPMNWRLSVTELSKLISSHEYGLVFADDIGTENISKAYELSGINDGKIYNLASFSEINVDELTDQLLPDSIEAYGEPDDSAIQLFTSGSTGRPKAVTHSTAGLISYFDNYTRASKWTSDTVYQSCANLFHMSGLSILISLIKGSKAVYFDKFDMDDFLSAIEKEKSTRISLVPTLVSRVLLEKDLQKYNISSVRKIVYSGSPMAMETVIEALDVFHCDLEQAYSATETCCMTVLTPEDHRRDENGSFNLKHLKSVGKVLPGITLRVSDTDTYSDSEVACGELEVKTPSLFKSINPDSGRRTEDGFFKTGDIGYIDDDGYVYLVSRKHDMIISGGENIYPRETEDCISLLSDDVSQVCVLGLPDPVWGENVIACVIRKPGSEITEEQIIEHCKNTIASYKKPKHVFFMDSFPLNANGKISRPDLKAELLNA